MAETKWHECGRKKRYDELGARIAASELQRKGDDVHHYKCRFCIAWHVGHVRRRTGMKRDENGAL